MANRTDFYFHQDALGSAVLTITTAIMPSVKAEYVPYGPGFGVTGSEAFQYTGKLLDEATGLYYEGARYYDPITGRFITEDSVAGSPSDPQSLNRYVYARDNPMKIVDMNGHEWWNPVANLVSAAVGDVAGAATNLANAASNEWNSLPPSDQAIVVAAVITTVAVTATVLTAGAASPVLVEAAEADAAVIGGAEATTAVVGDVAVTEAAATTSSLSGSLISAGVQAIQGAAVNTDVTMTFDAIAHKSPTATQVAESLAVGAIGGGLSTGFKVALGPGVGVIGKVVAYGGAGAVSTLVGSISNPSPSTTGVNAATAVGSGTLRGALEYGGAPEIVSRIIEYGGGVLGGFI